MMAADPITHRLLLARRLLYQFRGKPVLQAMAQSIGAELDEIETALAAIGALTVAAEDGVQLDGDGALLGVARAGRSDTDYRAAIQAQARINSGTARIEDVLFALGTILDAGAFGLNEPAPATVRVTVTAPLDGVGAPTGTELAALIDRITGLGIAHGLIYSEVDANSTFTLADRDTVQSSALQGLGDDAGATGGQLADALGAGV